MFPFAVCRYGNSYTNSRDKSCFSGRIAVVPEKRHEPRRRPAPTLRKSYSNLRLLAQTTDNKWGI